MQITSYVSKGTPSTIITMCEIRFCTFYPKIKNKITSCWNPDRKFKSFTNYLSMISIDDSCLHSLLSCCRSFRGKYWASDQWNWLASAKDGGRAIVHIVGRSSLTNVTWSAMSAPTRASAHSAVYCARAGSRPMAVSLDTCADTITNSHHAPMGQRNRVLKWGQLGEAPPT